MKINLRGIVNNLIFKKISFFRSGAVHGKTLLESFISVKTNTLKPASCQTQSYMLYPQEY